MPAQLIDGKAVAAKVRAEVKTQVEELKARRGLVPGLAVVRVGEDPASRIYVTGKRKACEEVGIRSWEHHLPDSISQRELLEIVAKLNADREVHGILVQLPLPKQIREQEIIAALRPEKDADGFHPMNAGALLLGQPGPRACTPEGIMRLLDEVKVDPRGKRAVVVGRSNIVGKPMALMLLQRDATVTICHSKTADLAEEVRRADIVVAAIGKARAIRGEWVKPGATVIDVGMNRLPDGKVVGDVEFDAAKERAAFITPVPGGVGPMTIAMLLANAVEAARASSP